MKRTLGLAVLGVALAGAGALAFLRRPSASEPRPQPKRVVRNSLPPAPPAVAPPAPSHPALQAEAPAAPPPPPSAVEKAARVEKINRDYNELRTKASADYSAAGAAFPGGLNAFLRQLALLERERRQDLAGVLTTAELEELEWRETPAGQLVQKHLGDTNATEEQRRAVFRRQRAFEEQFALTFDLAPAALLVRETARQQTQEDIRALLDPPLFAAWLRGEGNDFAQFEKFAAEQGLSADAPLELWRAKNEFARRRLELSAQTPDSSQQRRSAQAALVQQSEIRVLSIVGPGAMPAAREKILSWLPKR